MIVSHSIKQHASSLAAFMPSGRLFQAARTSTTNFRKFLEGLAEELQNSEGLLKSYQDEYSVRTTTLLIEEWEKALGIPDQCFSGTGTIEERRRDALAKLASLGVQTAEDFQAVAAIFGVSVNVFSGTAVGGFPVTFPFPLLGDPLSRFTIFIEYTIVSGDVFPMIFPFVLGDEGAQIMECLFQRLKPANVLIIFEEI